MRFWHQGRKYHLSIKRKYSLLICIFYFVADPTAIITVDFSVEQKKHVTDIVLVWSEYGSSMTNSLSENLFCPYSKILFNLILFLEKGNQNGREVKMFSLLAAKTIELK